MRPAVYRATRPDETIAPTPGTTADVRPVVEGWRFDLLGPWGWMRPHGTTHRLRNEAPTALGFFTAERATCLIASHPAPDPACVCGLHAVERLTEGLAEAVERLEAELDAQTVDGVPIRSRLGIVLSRVRLEHVVGGAWQKRDVPAGTHPDPPATLRAHRREHLGPCFVDVEEVADRAPDFLPLTFEHVASIPALIRDYIGRDDELAARGCR